MSGGAVPAATTSGVRASRVVVTMPVMCLLCPLCHLCLLVSRSVVTRVAKGAALLGSSGTSALDEGVASDGLPIGMPCMT